MNEIYFFALIFFCLASVLFCWRLGDDWLVALLAVNIVLCQIVVQKMTTVFGLSVSLAEPLYASIFVITDILSEHKGREAARRAVMIGFGAVAFIVIVFQAVLLMPSIEETQTMANAMEALYSTTPRLALASMVTYLLIQNFDVMLFGYLKKRTGGRHLWLRNNLSTGTSQTLDSALFTTLAFAGVLPLGVMVQICVSMILIKWMIAAMDTPILYLSYKVRGKSLPERPIPA